MSSRKLVAYLLLSWPVHTLMYFVVPIAIGSTLSWPHVQGAIAVGLRVVALAPLAAGTGLLAWAVVSHYHASPDKVQLATPNYLARGGAYGRSRNPLYLAGAFTWLGWALFLHSAPVALVGAAMVAGFALVAVPFEERGLRERFGAEYTAYCDRVPRWL